MSSLRYRGALLPAGMLLIATLCGCRANFGSAISSRNQPSCSACAAGSSVHQPPATATGIEEPMPAMQLDAKQFPPAPAQPQSRFSQELPAPVQTPEPVTPRAVKGSPDMSMLPGAGASTRRGSDSIDAGRFERQSNRDGAATPEADSQSSSQSDESFIRKLGNRVAGLWNSTRGRRVRDQRQHTDWASRPGPDFSPLTADEEDAPARPDLYGMLLPPWGQGSRATPPAGQPSPADTNRDDRDEWANSNAQPRLTSTGSLPAPGSLPADGTTKAGARQSESDIELWPYHDAKPAAAPTQSQPVQMLPVQSLPVQSLPVQLQSPARQLVDPAPLPRITPRRLASQRTVDSTALLITPVIRVPQDDVR